MRDAFEPLHAEVGDRIALLGVDVEDTPAAARQVIERTGATYELAVDPDGELFTAFGGFGSSRPSRSTPTAAWSPSTPEHRPAPTWKPSANAGQPRDRRRRGTRTGSVDAA